MRLSGFTPVDLVISKEMRSRTSPVMDERNLPKPISAYLDRYGMTMKSLKDVTAEVLEHIDTVYQENPAERVYFHEPL